MSRDWYFKPEGSGTSGSGSKNNPIVGLSTIGSVGIAEGDRVIVSGRHYERLIVPQNGIRVISEGATFDGTISLSGNTTINKLHAIVDIAPWILVDSGLNIWKKDIEITRILFLNGAFVAPMPTSSNAVIESEVLAYATSYPDEIFFTLITNLQTDTSRTLYIKLGTGQTPNNTDIRVTKYIHLVDSTAGMLQATEKNNLEFEGEFVFNNISSTYGTSIFMNLWLDRCNAVSNKNGRFSHNYSLWGTCVTAGDDISISTHANYLYNGAVRIDAADPVSGTQYVGGTIEIKDWYANYCGWLPRYNGINNSWVQDADGGVAIGYKGGSLETVAIKRGVCLNGGPSVATLPTGWGGTLDRGSGVFVGTSDTFTLKNLEVEQNVFDSVHRTAIHANGRTWATGAKVKIVANVIKNHRAINVANNGGVGYEKAIISARFIAGNPVIDLDVSSNLIFDSETSYSTIGVGNVTSLTSGVTFANNVIQNTVLASGYSATGGHFYIYDNLTGEKNVDRNIVDAGLNGKYAQFFAASYTSMSALNTALGKNNIEGTVTVNDDYSLTAGTADPIGTGVKYWNDSPRPNDFYGNPLPDKGIDIGAVQGTSHEFHPINL